jgi:hypothetical protein
VDCGYVCKWHFPSKGTQGYWEATVTQEGEYKGKEVTCSLKDFSKKKWNQVYGDNAQEPCKWCDATPAMKKAACRSFLEQAMANILSS